MTWKPTALLALLLATAARAGMDDATASGWVALYVDARYETLAQGGGFPGEESWGLRAPTKPAVSERAGKAEKALLAACANDAGRDAVLKAIEAASKDLAAKKALPDLPSPNQPLMPHPAALKEEHLRELMQTLTRLAWRARQAWRTAHPFGAEDLLTGEAPDLPARIGHMSLQKDARVERAEGDWLLRVTARYAGPAGSHEDLLLTVTLFRSETLAAAGTKELRAHVEAKNRDIEASAPDRIAPAPWQVEQGWGEACGRFVCAVSQVRSGSDDAVHELLWAWHNVLVEVIPRHATMGKVFDGPNSFDPPLEGLLDGCALGWEAPNAK